jgi:hypothetical protein
MQVVAWIILGVFSVIRFEPDYVLVVGVCLSLGIANIVGFTKCRKGIRILPLNANYNLKCFGINTHNA